MYDAIVVGSGPNGLSAGIRLALEGYSVKIIEASGTIGGGTRTKELIKPGVHHDICSAIHPMAVSSPFLKKLPLDKFGLEWIHPDIPAVHPMDHEPAVAMYQNLFQTAENLGTDREFYKRIAEPLQKNWNGLSKDFLGPLRFPKHPFQMALFGLKALQPATLFQKQFQTERAKALFAGMAAHSLLPLDAIATTAIALVFFGTAHTGGWPLARGGSQSIANAMAAYFKSLGGEIQTDTPVVTLNQLPSHKVVMFDLSPEQMLKIAGDRFPQSYHQKINRFRRGSGVFKVDFILKEPVPWRDETCKKGGTVHVGGTFEEIAASEKMMDEGGHPEKPFVLVTQQSLFDNTRTPDDRETLWAYCHVPNGSTRDMTNQIENQIERFAPGFRDIIDEKRSMNTQDFQNYNSNYLGGDINGGRQDITQLFTRPVNLIHPYATPAKGIYICSASTPPGGGVHGMCGYHASNLVLKKEFDKKTSEWNFRI